MWIEAIGGEDELGSTGVVGAGGEECVIGTGKVGTKSKAGAANIMIWGS